MSNPRAFLRSSEWLLTGSLLIFLFANLTISKIKAFQTSSECRPEPTLVDVSIDGHVKKPGIYKVALGTPIHIIVKKALPKKNADLAFIARKEILSQPCSFYVSPLQELSICIEGEVQEPGIVCVPIGSRICDLKHKVILSPDGDSKYFKKRRLLQNGEIIRIPARSHSSSYTPIGLKL